MIAEKGCVPYLKEAVRKVLEAVRHGDLRAVRQILGDDPSAANASWVAGYSPPEYPNVQNECVPLFMICQGVFDGTNRKGNEYEIARALIDAGADIHVNEDALLSSAAASLGAMGVARALLEAGAPIDGPQDGRREEPLCAALFFGFTELSEYLASQGAMLDMRFAAGLGQLEKVKSYFNDDGSLKPGAGELSMMSGICTVQSGTLKGRANHFAPGHAVREPARPARRDRLPAGTGRRHQRVGPGNGRRRDLFAPRM